MLELNLTFYCLDEMRNKYLITAPQGTQYNLDSNEDCQHYFVCIVLVAKSSVHQCLACFHQIYPRKNVSLILGPSTEEGLFSFHGSHERWGWMLMNTDWWNVFVGLSTSVYSPCLSQCAAEDLY